jgi:hypothetical protein
MRACTIAAATLNSPLRPAYGRQSCFFELRAAHFTSTSPGFTHADAAYDKTHKTLVGLMNVMWTNEMLVLP